MLVLLFISVYRYRYFQRQVASREGFEFVLADVSKEDTSYTCSPCETAEIKALPLKFETGITPQYAALILAQVMVLDN